PGREHIAKMAMPDSRKGPIRMRNRDHLNGRFRRRATEGRLAATRQELPKAGDDGELDDRRGRGSADDLPVGGAHSYDVRARLQRWASGCVGLTRGRLQAEPRLLAREKTDGEGFFERR